MKSTKSFAIVLILLSMVSCTTGKEFDFDNSKLTIESLVKQYNLELAEQIISSDSLHPLSLKEMKEILEQFQNIGKNSNGKIIDISPNLSRGHIVDMGTDPYPSSGTYRKGIVEDLILVGGYPISYYLTNICIEFRFWSTVTPQVLTSYELPPTVGRDSRVIRYTHNQGFVTYGDNSYFNFTVLGYVLLNYDDGTGVQTYLTSVVFKGFYQNTTPEKKEAGEFKWYVS